MCKCPNNWYICSHCGSCCSNNIFDQRREHLLTTGRFIPENLTVLIDKGLGHMEKGEYYCWVCGNHMSEIGPKIYQCDKDGTKYDTKKL